MAPKARILAIDEQLYLRSFVEGVLSEAGYAVRALESEAKAAAENGADSAPQVVIFDPVQLGPDVITAVVRVRGRWPQAALLAISASSDPRWGVAAMRAGAGDCLQKPLDRGSLIASVAALLVAEPSRARATPAPSATPPDGRLLDENVLLMGRVSLLERGLALFAEPSADALCRRFAELVRQETGAQTIELWAGPGAENELGFSLVHGDAPRVTPAEVWRSEGRPRDELLRTGRAVSEPVRGNPAALPFLLVPCARNGRLLGVARLTPGARGAFGARELEISTRLGELAALALDRERERESLARSSFRDPLTSLPGREFLDEVGRTEVHKAHRFGRRLSLLCVDLDGFDPEKDSGVVPALVAAVGRTLRTTDVLASEAGRRFWVLVTDTDPLGGVVLKRRIAQRLRDVLREARASASPALGVANFPVDGDSLEALAAAAHRRVQEEHSSVVRALGIEPETPLSAMGARLLDRALWLPREFVAEAAELMIGDLACRPRDRGLLFLAPGPERPRFLAPLTALGDMETATEVFLATDGDTIPSGPAVTALSLPPNVSADTSWIVRFGEGPPYALVAGKPRADGARPIFHSNDPVLVEHLTFRLRAETGFGVRA